MSRFFFLVKEAFTNLRRNALVVAGAVVAVFVSLGLAFAALVVNEVLRVNTLAWQEGVRVIGWLNDEGTAGVPPGSHQTLISQVESWDEVEGVVYYDKNDAWNEFQRIFASQPEMLDIDPTVLPASVRIELVEIEFHQSVQFRLDQQVPVVREVATAAEEIEQLRNLSSVLNVGALGLAVVLGMSAVVLIANTIRLAIYARRDEVAVMKLVGASNWFIRVPFLLEGLIEGLVGAAIAVFTVWVGFSQLADATQTFALFQFQIGNQFFLRWGLLFLLFGAAAGVLGSLLGLSRYLRDAEGVGELVPAGV